MYRVDVSRSMVILCERGYLLEGRRTEREHSLLSPCTGGGATFATQNIDTDAVRFQMAGLRVAGSTNPAQIQNAKHLLVVNPPAPLSAWPVSAGFEIASCADEGWVQVFAHGRHFSITSFRLSVGSESIYVDDRLFKASHCTVSVFERRSNGVLYFDPLV